jgi:hypothetical protein
MVQKNDSFREAFLQVLADTLPCWKGYIENASNHQPIQVSPPNWNGPPFRIEIYSDTVSIFPLCDFGIDYISTATSEDLKERPQLVFERVVSEIADFVGGRTVVAIKRRRWLFMKAGWDVRFLPLSAVDGVRRSGASIIAWPA